MLQNEFAGRCQLPGSYFAHHLDVALQGSDEAVSNTVVIDAPLNLVIAAKGKRQQSVVVLDLAELEGMDRCNGLVDLRNLVALEGGLLSEGAITESHADEVLLEEQLSMTFYVIIDTVGNGYRYFSLSVWTRCADFLLRVCGKTRKEQDRKEK